jgi:hypothetical protein
MHPEQVISAPSSQDTALWEMTPAILEIACRLRDYFLDGDFGTTLFYLSTRCLTLVKIDLDSTIEANYLHECELLIREGFVRQWIDPLSNAILLHRRASWRRGTAVATKPVSPSVVHGSKRRTR